MEKEDFTLKVARSVLPISTISTLRIPRGSSLSRPILIVLPKIHPITRSALGPVLPKSIVSSLESSLRIPRWISPVTWILAIVLISRLTPSVRSSLRRFRGFWLESRSAFVSKWMGEGYVGCGEFFAEILDGTFEEFM